jgi:hypothetical protein
MGTTFQKIIRNKPVLEYFLEDTGIRREDVVAHNSGRGAFYAAVRRTNYDGLRLPYVMAFVVVVSRSRGEIGIKVDDEFMGPYYYGASAKVLAALTPIEDIARILPRSQAVLEWAARWRKACQETLEHKAAEKAAQPSRGTRRMNTQALFSA